MLSLASSETGNLLVLALLGIAVVLVLCGVMIGVLYYYWRDSKVEDKAKMILFEYIQQNKNGLRCEDCMMRRKANENDRY